MKKFSQVFALSAMMLVMAAPAFAGGELSDSIDNVRDNILSVTVLVNIVAYTLGFVMAVAGIAKLKAHVDNPGQTPIKDGLGRLAVAAMFVSLPFVIKMMQDTTSMGSGAVTYTKVSVIAS